MKNYIFIKQNYTIQKVFKLFENYKNSAKYGSIAICKDKFGKVIGVITLGDLRRILINKKNHKDVILNYLNKNFFYVYDDENRTNYITRYNEFKRKSKIKAINNFLILDRNKYLKSIEEISLVKENLNYYKVCVVGMGHVGLPMLNHLIKKGFDVTGYDKNIKLVKNLKNIKLPFYEKNLKSELLTHKSKRVLNFTSDFKKINAQIYIVCIGSELKEKKIKNKNFLSVIDNIIKKINEDDIIICRGTLPLGFTNKIFKKIKSKIRKKIYFGYCPERIVEGNAVEELENLPQIVSAVNGQSLKKISEFCNKTFINNIVVDTTTEAEFIKLMSNSYRDLIFSFSNEISRLSRAFNIDGKKLIDNANLGYKRNNIPIPSPGVGGSCLVKDPIIFSEKINNISGYKLGKVSRNINTNAINEIAKTINHNKNFFDIKNNKILIFGLAFKGFPETSDIRSSVTIDLIKILEKKNKIEVFDAVLEKNNFMHNQYKKLRLRNTKDISRFNMIIFMNNNLDNYLFLKKKIIKRKRNNKYHIFDFWNIANKEFVEHNGYLYHTLSKTYF